MKEIKGFLLDMDGVVTDTETQYENFWNRLRDKYNLKMDDFNHRVKGKRLKDIVSEFFSYLPADEQKNVGEDIKNFEMEEMIYTPIDGVVEFVKSLKEADYKTALVTGSLRIKAEKAMKDIGLTDYFDFLVTADDVTKGKPDPECFIKAAEVLNLSPSECIVFEDAFQGIESANKAGVAKIVGITTNYSEEELKDKTSIAIPNFKNISYQEILEKVK